MRTRTKRFIIFSLLIVALIAVLSTVLIYFLQDDGNSSDSVPIPARKSILWGYECDNGRCVRHQMTDENKSELAGLAHCRAKCDSTFNGLLWPAPRDDLLKDRTVGIIQEIDIDKIEIIKSNSTQDSKLVDGAIERFNEILLKRKLGKFVNISVIAIKLIIECNVIDVSRKFTHETDESYEISFDYGKLDDITIVIKAPTFFGFRHGLETLSQLIFYDEVHEHFFIQLMGIKDSPRFKHRGISVDTSRNFFSVDALKRNIDAMAMVKLNRFHWHISDSQSFPLLLKSHPDLATHSAYSMDEVYTTDDVRSLIEYGKVRGVQVYIEIDMPGHIGEGFAYKNLTSCFGHTPDDYCKLSKPCGQLDPSVDEVYQVLEDIFTEIHDLHDGEIDMAHLGGDEVFFECWNASSKLQQMMRLNGWDNSKDEGFMEVWGYFQQKVIESLDRAYDEKVPIVLWRSTLTLTPYLNKFLDKDRIIIQMWTAKDSPEVKEVLQNGFKMVISNYDVNYLDCGFGTWVRDAPDWCAPYHTWMNIYENRLEEISGDEYINQVLGAEAAIWSEQISEFELDGRIWPRLSALAERLWTDPPTSYREAEARMLHHRRQLVEHGIHAAAIQPEWCYHNQNLCPK